MNKFKFPIFIMVALLSLVTFNSCGDDDDDNSISREDAIKCIDQMRGQYTGTCRYWRALGADSATLVKDVAWTSGDSLMVKNFPLRSVASGLSDNYADLRKALGEQTTTEVVAYYGIYQVSPIAFFLTPRQVSLQVMYNNAPHLVTLAFYEASPYVYTYGRYVVTGNSPKVTFYMTLGGVYLDGKLLSEQDFIPITYLFANN